jgi:hypothetical protein
MTRYSDFVFVGIAEVEAVYSLSFASDSGMGRVS